MVREYKWKLAVRSYEHDAWGLVSSANVLRYLEQSAVAAAADAGFDEDFHAENRTGWVIRRMAMHILVPVHSGCNLEIATWASHFTRVRGGREYRVQDADTGQEYARGLAEWVYVDRDTLKPLPIPADAIRNLDPPGEPRHSYDPPPVSPLAGGRQFTFRRTAEWHEIDSLGHVNNAMYADWLDDALKAAQEELGFGVLPLQEEGLHLRGEHHTLEYKRAALPGDGVLITTTFNGIEGRLCLVRQEITHTAGYEILTARTVCGWRLNGGEPAEPPSSWEAALTAR